MSENNQDDIMIGKVLRWGMDVASYREQCRHIQSRMPAKKPVVVSSSSSEENSANPSPRQLFASTPKGEHYVDEGLDLETQHIIRAAWDAAGAVLRTAAQLAKENNRDGKRLRNMETLCRHVDYVITGKFRSLEETTGETPMERMDRHYDPPPVDLFDSLLAELQSMVGSGTTRAKEKTRADEKLETPR